MATAWWYMSDEEPPIEASAKHFCAAMTQEIFDGLPPAWKWFAARSSAFLLLAAVVADEGPDSITAKVWWVPAFLAVWVTSNAIGNLLARILPPLHGSFSVGRYQVTFDFEPRAARRFRAERQEP
jgi:hypothetical protein